MKFEFSELFQSWNFPHLIPNCHQDFDLPGEFRDPCEILYRWLRWIRIWYGLKWRRCFDYLSHNWMLDWFDTACSVFVWVVASLENISLKILQTNYLVRIHKNRGSSLYVYQSLAILVLGLLGVLMSRDFCISWEILVGGRRLKQKLSFFMRFVVICSNVICDLGSKTFQNFWHSVSDSASQIKPY